MIHSALTRRLRNFAGTEFAQAAMSRTLPPDFSRAALFGNLRTVRSALPDHPLAERIFGEPAFLKSGASSARITEWELSRATLLSAIGGLSNKGFSLVRDGGRLRYSFSHTSGVALAIVVVGSGHAPDGVGVDLELASREISDGAYAKFHTAAERPILDRPLDHWVLKEAAFKAHSRAGETIVADYVVTTAEAAVSPDLNEYRLECRRGEVEFFRGLVGSVEEFRYAFVAAGAGSS